MPRDPSTTSKLLLDEYPLIILPSLALAIGDRDAVFIQQVYYWMRINQEREDPQMHKRGRWWTYARLPDWQKQLPWMSISTIRRIISRGHNRGYLIVAVLNTDPTYQRKWYSVDTEALHDYVDHWRLQHPKAPPVRSQNEQMEQLILLAVPPVCTARGQDEHMIHEINIENKHDRVWALCKSNLSMQMTQDAFNQWIATSNLTELDTETQVATIRCSSSYSVDWLQNRLDIIIRRTLAALLDLTDITITYTEEANDPPNHHQPTQH